MKKITLIKFLILALLININSSTDAADLNIDFVRKQAFENKLYKTPEQREVTLFTKPEKTKNKKKAVEVEYIDKSKNLTEINLTDEEYIKKFKRANKKSIRKKQFDITIQKNTSSASQNDNDENYLNSEKNVLAGEKSTTEEDNSAKTYDPKNKNFFDNNKTEQLKSDKKLFRKKQKNKTKDKEDTNTVKSNMILTAEITDYFPERTEIEAKGNAKLEITGQDFVLYGDKIVFNHETNSIRAYDNVKIIKENNVTTGDFINIDMNTAHGWIQKPVSSNYSIRIKANEAYIFPDKIEEYEGVANILEDKRFEIDSSNYTGLLKAIQPSVGDFYFQKPEPTAMKFKVKDINVESQEGHNIITMKNVGIYYKKYRLGVMPQIKLVTDKEQSIMQTNIPEIGSDSNMGMYVGPSIVLNTPLSSTLRIAPLLIYSEDEKKFGVGGAATFMSSSNTTEMGYGSPENKFLLRGSQKITPKLNLNYSQNMYTSQWFLGYRRPMYSTELEFNDNVYIKDLGLDFTQNLSGGIYSDYARISKLSEGRLRWMTQLHKNFYTYTNRANTFSMDLGLIGQTSISQYTSGDTFGIARIAPSLITTYKGWSQNIMYFQSGVTGHTPFIFDDYYYGKSNLLFLETLRLNKYITVGYLASMVLGKRETYSSLGYNPNTDKFFQENMFLLSFGPDEAKLTISYDAYRKTTAVYFSMLLGTKDMNIAFKKATINNPDTLMNENKKIPVIKDTFDKIRYKIFPATNPDYDKAKDLYKYEIENFDNEKLKSVDDSIDEEEDQEVYNQFKNQINPIIQNINLMKDDRI